MTPQPNAQQAPDTNQKLTSADWVSYYLYQDGLMWRRLQLLGIVQVATMTAAYALRPQQVLAIGILVFGAILSLLLYFLLKRDQEYRDCIEKKISVILLVVPRKPQAPLKGREIVWILFGVLAVVNVILMFVILCSGTCTG